MVEREQRKKQEMLEEERIRRLMVRRQWGARGASTYSAYIVGERLR
jgi:hypothetical protein